LRRYRRHDSSIVTCRHHASIPVCQL
jgi:hypothetical protein